jgi:leucyl-tRNA synthetase
MNQGQVLYGGASMSKTRGNVVEPMPIVDRWGADTMRLTMLFAGPFEDDIDWMLIAPDPARPPGVHGWLGRVWRAVIDASVSQAPDPHGLRRFAHRTVKAVTADMERFKFNTAISKMMELTNEMRRALDGGGGAGEAARLLVLMLAPIAPFIAEELWREELGGSHSVHVEIWPTFDPELAREETVTLVVQVDGKVRDRIEVPDEAGEEACREAALSSERVRRALGDRSIERVITRPPRLINLVTVAK